MATTFLYVALLFAILMYFFRKFLSQKSSGSTENLQRSKTKVFSMLTLCCWTLKCGGSCIKVCRQVGKTGKVTKFRLGNIGFVAINDLTLGKEIFQNPVFSARPSNVLVKITTDETEGTGIAINSGKNWKDQRKFCHQHLKQFGFGTKSMESLIQQEIHDLLEKWSSKGGQRFSPNKDFYIPVLSSLWVLLVGERISIQDTKLISIILGMFVSFRNLFNVPEFALVLTDLKLTTINRIAKWIPLFPGILEMQQAAKELRSYYKPVIQARKETLNYGDTPSNLQDHYLLKLFQTTDIHSNFYGESGEKNLIQIIQDFMVGGGDTTANTLSWGMLHLIRNPVVQENVRKEIDSQVGKDRQPCLQDIPNCPYTFAFILELLRSSPIASVGIPHVATEDINVGPYFFRKDEYILLNIYSIHHDPLIWGDPENFRPERFLSADGKTVVKNEAMCVFSIGQRRCVGEQVAYDNLFLFISSICQRFILHADPLLKHPPLLKDENTAFYVPNEFHMVAQDRLI